MVIIILAFVDGHVCACNELAYSYNYFCNVVC